MPCHRCGRQESNANILRRVCVYDRTFKDQLNIFAVDPDDDKRELCQYEGISLLCRGCVLKFAKSLYGSDFPSFFSGLVFRDTIMTISEPHVLKLIVVRDNILSSIVDITPLQICFCQKLPEGDIYLMGVRLSKAQSFPFESYVGRPIEVFQRVTENRKATISSVYAIHKISHLRDSQFEIYETFFHLNGFRVTKVDRKAPELLLVDGCYSVDDQKEREELILQLDILSGIRPLLLLVCEYDHLWNDAIAQSARIQEQTKTVLELEAEYEESARKTKDAQERMNDAKIVLSLQNQKWNSLSIEVRKQWKAAFTESFLQTFN